jgi:hypothetical protein
MSLSQNAQHPGSIRKKTLVKYGETYLDIKFWHSIPNTCVWIVSCAFNKYSLCWDLHGSAHFFMFMCVWEVLSNVFFSIS